MIREDLESDFNYSWIDLNFCVSIINDRRKDRCVRSIFREAVGHCIRFIKSQHFWKF